ncbi:MAG: type II secretion system major pseudopilin GspG [Verrucomicrobia bacterium]|nr:type II secretion system major pseudopilin GspG [Verrucomicrobiota bacterium]
MTPPPQATSGLAIASLVTGILGFVTLGLGSIAAIITGHLALSEIRKSLGSVGGKGLAIAGLILGYLCVCILALGIVAATAIPSFSTIQNDAQRTRVESDLQAIKLALKSYESRALALPTTEQGLRALVDKPRIEPIPASWRALMEDIPTDPWGHEYRYRFPAQKSAQAFDLFSLGPDGIEGDEDDITNW